MKNQSIQPGEWEDISAYLDGRLSTRQRQKFERRLDQREDLRIALEEIRQTRTILRNQAVIKAPRNFILNPELVGAKKPYQVHSFAARMVPALSFSAGLAGVLFILIVISSVFLVRPTSQSILIAEKAAPEVFTPSATIQAPAAQMLITEEPAIMNQLPYPDISPEMEIPKAEIPLPALTEGIGGGMGSGLPSPTEPSLSAAAPSEKFTAPYSSTESSGEIENTPEAADRSAEAGISAYPSILPTLPTLEPEGVYPAPEATVTQALTRRINVWNVLAAVLAIIALVTGITAYLLHRSIKAK
jgi:anti-sigma factor RsiW